MHLDSSVFQLLEIPSFCFTFQNTFRFLLTTISEFEKIDSVARQSQTRVLSEKYYSDELVRLRVSNRWSQKVGSA